MNHHLDESGNHCTRHATAAPEAIFELALLGSSVPSFHHDIASKLQSLIMTFDELGDVAVTTELRNIVATAGDTVRELGSLLAANRSLARSPRRERHAITKLIGLAASRSGVRAEGAIPTSEAEVGLLATTHALALIFDLAAGPVALGRRVEIAGSTDAAFAVLDVIGPAAAIHPPPSNYSEVMALASFAFAREAGQLRCGPGRFTIRLPLVA